MSIFVLLATVAYQFAFLTLPVAAAPPEIKNVKIIPGQVVAADLGGSNFVWDGVQQTLEARLGRNAASSEFGPDNSAALRVTAPVENPEPVPQPLPEPDLNLTIPSGPLATDTAGSTMAAFAGELQLSDLAPTEAVDPVKATSTDNSQTDAPVSEGLSIEPASGTLSQEQAPVQTPEPVLGQPQMDGHLAAGEAGTADRSDASENLNSSNHASSNDPEFNKILESLQQNFSTSTASSSPQVPPVPTVEPTNPNINPDDLSLPVITSATSTLVLAPALEFSRFSFGDENFSTSTLLQTLKIKLSLAGIAVPLAQLQLEYSIGTSTWQSAGGFGLQDDQSNAIHGGYFSAVIPSDLLPYLGELRLRLVYEADQDSLSSVAGKTVFQLDGLWLEARYEDSQIGDQSDENLTDQLDALSPESFEHLDFYNSLLALSMPADLANPITLSQPNIASSTLQMLIKGVSSSATSTREGDSITYSGAFLNTDLIYELKNRQLKENIIFKNQNHPNRFRYLLNLKKYDYKLENNVLSLYAKGHGEQDLYKRYSISAPVMTDANGAKSQDITLRLVNQTLIVTPSADWLAGARYPVTVDPTVEITVLNVHSHPVAGEKWNIDFTTVGQDDLTITPADADTVSDMQFESLMCGSEDRSNQVQKQDQGILFYPQWSCDDIATASFLDLKTGDHHMIFGFGGATADAYNSTITWDGGGGDANWNTNANWSGDVAPGSGDLANFDNTCAANCSPTINVSVNVGGINMASTYAGAITQATDTVATIGSSNFVIVGGTFIGSASTTSSSIVLNGSFSQTGGAFTAPKGNFNVNLNMTLSAGTFSHNSGTVQFFDSGSGENSTLTCAGSPFNKVIITKDNSSSAFNINNGASACTVPLGSSPTTAINGASTWNGTVTIASGTWTVNGETPSITLNGTINHSGSGWVSQGGLVLASSGVVTYSGAAASFMGDLNIATGTFPSGLTVTFNDGSTVETSNLTCSGSPFAKVIITKDNGSSAFNINNGASTCTVPLGASPTTAISAASTWNGNITVDSGTWTQAYAGNYNITLNGTLTHSGSGWVSHGGLVLGSGAVVTYAGTAASFMKDLNIASGTFPSGLDITFNDDSTVEPSVLTMNSSTTLGSLTINRTQTNSPFDFGSNATTTGNLTFSGGASGADVNNPSSTTTVAVMGNFSQSSSANFGGSKLILSFASTTTSTISHTAGTFASPFLVSKTGSGLAQISSSSFTVSTSTCSVNSGIFDINGKAFTCGGSFSVASGSTLTLMGSETTVTTPSLATGSTVLYKGDGNGSASTVSDFKNWSYSNLTISTTDSGDTVSGSSLATTTVLNTLLLAAGYFTTPTTLTVTGNINNTGGNLTGTSGTVVLNGSSQQLTGSTTFYSLTKITSSTDTLTFGASTLTTISGTMTLQGAASNLLSLRSSVSGTQAKIDPQGTRTISYLDVKDSNNINNSVILTSGFNIANSGNNLRWAFASLTQTQYQFFQNQDSLQPASFIGALNATTTITTTSSPIRLRMNLQVMGDALNAGDASFKLQVATSSAGTWTDIVPVTAGWYNSSWVNRRKITFNNASSTSNLTNFPVLVSLNATTTGNIDYSKTKAGGVDIRFTDSDGVTLLPYEIEKWDTSATSTVWVKVPSIASASTTDNIYIYYNNPAASDNATTTGVWDSNFKGVWHLASGTSLSLVDSTANSTSVNNGVTATTTGQIDGAANFNGSSQYIDTGGNSGLNITGNITLSAWINPTGVSGVQFALAKDNNDGRGYGFGLTGSKVYFEKNGAVTLNSGSNASANAWQLIEVSYDGTTWSSYLNGAFSASTTGAAIPSQTTVTVKIGRRDYPGFESYFGGRIDEVRISSTSRSSDWILAEYKTGNNQMNSYAAEETGSAYGWNFYDNPSVTSSGTISSVLLPASNVQETYQEGNPTSWNPNSATAGQYIEYDFALSPQSAVSGTTYYFRMVRNDGVILDSYTNYPAVTLALSDNAPNAPSALGPASVTGGGWITTSTPSFTFTLTDPDVADTVKYQIQISTSSAFSTEVVDYTSALAAQGAASFTVGQSAGSGSYTTGSSATRLADSSSGYYWRVYNIDNSGAFSASTTANSGAVAFKVDTATPTPGTLAVATTSTTSLTASISGASDSLSGLSATPYIFYNLTASTNSSATSSASWLSSGLSVNTQYTFYAQVSDAAGNTATTSNASKYSLANIPTGLAVAADSATQITLSWNANSNPAGTEYYALNSTASTTSGWITTTSTSFSSLTCNTSYSFNVKARNGNGVETATTSLASATTSACSSPGNGGGSTGGGGGGSYPTPPPGGFKIIINNGAATTATTSVVLTLIGGSDAKNMMVSNRADFAGAVQEPYIAAKNWIICAFGSACPDGDYTVYAKFFSASGLPSPSVSDSIILNAAAIPPSPALFTVDLLASLNQKTWVSPLQNIKLNQKISLKATLSAASSGHDIFYQFDCSSDGKFEKLFDHSQKTTYIAHSLCAFPQPGIYTARVLATLNGYTAMSTVVIAVGTVITPPPPPPPTYNSCQNNACVVVSGAGINSCHSNFDCTSIPPPNYSVCQNQACVIVAGVGNNSCVINSDCQAPVAHNVCQNQACVIVSGAGGNQCAVNADCSVANIPATADSSRATSAWISGIGQTLKEIVNRLANIAGRGAKFVSGTGRSIGSALDNIYSTNRQFASGINTLAIAPTILALQYSLAQNGLALRITSLKDIWWLILQLVNSVLTFFGLRKRRRYWGTVYDSKNKQPIDPAIVELVDVQTGAVLEQAITDLVGRFGFLDRPGSFRLRAGKSNYRFPSRIILGNSDGMFDNLYHGEIFTITEPSDVISPNIPMDPLGTDWNQQDKTRIVKFHTKTEFFIYTFLNILFWGGAISTFLQVALHPNIFSLLLAVTYGLLLILQTKIKRTRLAGFVTSSFLSVNELLLEASPKLLPTVVVGRAMTDPSGKFFLKLPAGEFLLKVKRIKGELTETLVSMNIHMPRPGVFNQTVSLDDVS